LAYTIELHVLGFIWPSWQLKEDFEFSSHVFACMAQNEISTKVMKIVTGRIFTN